MKKLLGAALAAALCWAGAASASTATDTAAIKATIRHGLSSAGPGDAFASDAGSALDEFAPFHWDTIGDWGTAYANYNSQNAVTAPRTTIVKFDHVNVSGDGAYAVVSVAYSYKEDGRARKETGTDTFTLGKTAGHWQVRSFAWASAGGVDAGADAGAIVSLIHAQDDDFNAGKLNAFAPAATAIIDEFAPFHWQGASAAADWSAALAQGNAQLGVTALAIKQGAPSQLNVNGDDAYAVFPTLLTFKMKRKPGNEHGTIAFALHRSPAGWNVVSWAWVDEIGTGILGKCRSKTGL
jgi:hypothetical protein